LTQVINPLGQQVLAVTYDAEARVSRLIDADGDFTYAYQGGVGTNLALGATATASSYYTSYYTPSQAIDNNTDTYYLSARWPGDAWIQIDFPSPVSIYKV
jgi:hypothetical protein